MNIVFIENEQTIYRSNMNEVCILPTIGETVILQNALYKVVNTIIDYENEIIMYQCEEV